MDMDEGRAWRKVRMGTCERQVKNQPSCESNVSKINNSRVIFSELTQFKDVDSMCKCKEVNKTEICDSSGSDSKEFAERKLQCNCLPAVKPLATVISSIHENMQLQHNLISRTSSSTSSSSCSGASSSIIIPFDPTSPYAFTVREDRQGEANRKEDSMEQVIISANSL